MFSCGRGEEDRFIWRFSADGTYSASSAYRAMFTGTIRLRGAKHLWKASVPPKVKYFFWLAIHDRCWTASRRKKRGLQDCDLCALCHQESETMQHLLVTCVFTREVWARLSISLSLPQPPAGSLSVLDQWLAARKLLPKDLRRGLMPCFFWCPGSSGRRGTIGCSRGLPPCRLGFCQ